MLFGILKDVIFVVCLSYYYEPHVETAFRNEEEAKKFLTKIEKKEINNSDFNGGTVTAIELN